MRAFLYFHPCLLLNITTGSNIISHLWGLCVQSHNRNAFTEQVSFSLDFKRGVSKEVLQRSMGCTCIKQNKTPLFPGVTTRTKCLKHRLSSSALILRAEVLGGTVSADCYIHVTLPLRILVIKGFNVCDPSGNTPVLKERIKNEAFPWLTYDMALY